MKRLLIFAALVLGLASCQREPEGLDLNVGGEVATEITVSLPEDVTRAVAGTDSAQSDINAILAKGDLKLRYILQVFDAEGDSFKAMDFKYADAKSVVFPVRLVPNRHYRFVVWADLVENDGLVDGQDCDDLHYVIGTSLRDIKLADEWKAMDETRDAYTGYYKTTGNGFVGTESINITLTRPFAKLRVVTTDIDELFDGVYPHNAVVTYTTNHYKAFDAFAATPGDRTLAGKQHTYVIDTYSSETDPKVQMTLYTDYFFATEEDDAVRFNIDVKEADGTTIKLSSFNTDIKVKRNYLTTLIGDVLTEGNNVNVNVQPGLGGTENPDIVYNVITSGAELAQAVANGGSYKVGNNIYVAATRATIFATRAAGDDTTTINLNGFTITFEDGATVEVPAGQTLVINDESDNNTGGVVVENGGDGGFVVENGGTLTIESGNIGEGAIENNGTTNLEGGNFADGAVVNGADGEANISNGDVNPDAVTGTGEVKNYAAELVDAFEAGEDYQLVTDITIAEGLTLAKGKTMTLDLNGKTLSSTSTQTGTNYNMLDVRGTLTVENGTITTKHEGENMAWNNSTNVFNVTDGGVLNLVEVTAKNLGGSDMAFVAHLNNWGEVTLNVENSTLESTYIAVRVFNSGPNKNNVDIQNTTLGGKYCFWVHNYTLVDFGNDATKTAKQQALLNVDIFNGTNTFKFNNAKNAAALYGFDDELYFDAEGNYLVGDVVSLKSLAKFVNGGNKLQGKSVKLTADIDLAGEEWTPIGNSTNTFNGTFDGNGKSIKNLNIVETEAKEGKAYIGFFGYANNATIKNVTFENVNLNIPCLDIDHSQGHIGAVAGSLEGTSTIENVTVKGDIKVYATQEANGASRVAVVAGGNSYGNVTMENVHVIANDGSYLKANNNAGALAGQLQGKSVCKNCSSNIDVTVNKFFAGGLIGLAAGDQLFENCHTTGDIAVVAGREGRAHDQYRVGGIAGGWADGKNNVCTLTNCSYTGNVSGKNSDGSVADPLDYAGYVGRGYTLNGCQGSTVVIDGIKYIQRNNDAANAGIYDVVDAEGNCFVGDADTLVAALENKYGVLFTDNIKIDPAEMSNAYGTTGINVKNGQTIDGNGFTLDIKGAGGTWDSGINTTGGLIKNLTVTGSFRGIFINHNSTHAEKVVLENVTIEGTTYTISCDQGTDNGLEATNSKFNGWTSYAATLGDAKFTDCYFGEGNGYAFCRPYAPTEFVGCEFEAGYTLDPRAAVTFENCTLDGVTLTAENIAELVTNTTNVTVK